VRYTRGVNSIVGGAQEIWQVDQQIIDLLQQQEDGEGYVRLVTKLKTGERGEITGGPFKGLTGILAGHLKPAERVMVLLQTIGMQARLEIEKDFLQKAR